jgi:hypothetical protein
MFSVYLHRHQGASTTDINNDISLAIKPRQ